MTCLLSGAATLRPGSPEWVILRKSCIVSRYVTFCYNAFSHPGKPRGCSHLEPACDSWSRTLCGTQHSVACLTCAGGGGCSGRCPMTAKCDGLGWKVLSRLQREYWHVLPYMTCDFNVCLQWTDNEGWQCCKVAHYQSLCAPLV